MGQSLKLFSVRGIDIRIHITFPLILIWSALQFGLISRGGWEGAVFGIIATLLLFVLVILHELGHSIAAQYYGIEVKQIVLLPIGGVALLTHIPEKPMQEFVIALAGPAVNFSLALILGAIAWIAGFSLSLERIPAMLIGLNRLSLLALFGYAYSSNLLLAVFNLIPAYPMDGGRILRAALAARLPHHRATLVAVGIGQALAVLMGIFGFVQGNFFWVLIALFIYSGAGQERQLVQARSILGGLTVDQAFSRDARHLSPENTLQDAVEMTLSTFQSDFPVCAGEQLVGILTHIRLVEALNKFGPESSIETVMLREVPAVGPADDVLLAQRRLAELQIDALPVVEAGKFLGLITNRDISEIYRLAAIRADLLGQKIQTALTS